MNIRQLSSWHKKEVEEVLKQSYRLYKSPVLDIRIAFNNSTGKNRIGRILAITPKAIGCAPVRNTFRRRVKALFYEEKLYKHSYYWIVFAKKGAPGLSYAYLKKIFLETALKASQTCPQKK